MNLIENAGVGWYVLISAVLAWILWVYVILKNEEKSTGDRTKNEGLN